VAQTCREFGRSRKIFYKLKNGRHQPFNEKLREWLDESFDGIRATFSGVRSLGAGARLIKAYPTVGDTQVRWGRLTRDHTQGSGEPLDALGAR